MAGGQIVMKQFISEKNSKFIDLLSDSQNLRAILRSNDSIPSTTKSITAREEIAFMCLYINATGASNILEIGTYFAETTKILGNWIGRTGKLTTIDPYGAHRVPQLLEKFEKQISDKIQYLPMYSMEFFASFSEKRQESSTFNFELVFVDGNHNYEYALFDILSSSKVISADGIIVVDNSDQDSVALALTNFLENQKDFLVVGEQGIIATNHALEIFKGKKSTLNWIALMPTKGLTINSRGIILDKKYSQIITHKIIFPILEANEGILRVAITTTCWPHDYHLTGQNLRQTKDVFNVNVTKNMTQISFPLDHNIPELDFDNRSYVTLDLELSFKSEKENELILFREDTFNVE